MGPGTDIVTQNGTPASRLGLAGNPGTEPEFVASAFRCGVNTCFFYNLGFKGMVAGVRAHCAENRDDTVVATGTESRDPREMAACLDEVRAALDVDAVDVFFAEYVSPSDDIEAVLGPGGAIEQIRRWKDKGAVRYVGATTHNRPLALRLIESGRIDVLMHRYNMAHRGSEAEVLPAAREAGIPVVAFTCTRWASLLKGHPKWTGVAPTAADCYRFVLMNPAVRIALSAPATAAELADNVEMLDDAGPPDAETVRGWEAYGALVYGSGRDAFETEWP